MDSQLARVNTRYYVGRRELEGPLEEVVHLTDYNRLFITEEAFSRTDGFNEAVTANRVAAYFNNIEEVISKDLDLPKRFHYYTYKKDDQVMTLGNYDVAKEEETPPEEEVVNDNSEGTEEGA